MKASTTTHRIAAKKNHSSYKPFYTFKFSPHCVIYVREKNAAHTWITTQTLTLTHQSIRLNNLMQMDHTWCVVFCGGVEASLLILYMIVHIYFRVPCAAALCLMRHAANNFIRERGGVLMPHPRDLPPFIVSSCNLVFFGARACSR